MKILLVNVDSRWNMAIRKMYSYYKQDHDVEMIDLGLSGYPHKRREVIDASEYDKVCISNIFDINSHRVEVTGCDDVTFGGIGSRDPHRQLPPEIENTEPFYFDDEDTSYGFITRGCIRKCWFCKVPKFEGDLKLYNDIKVEFNQGLDFRLVNDENLEALSKLNYMGAYIFAFDEPKYQKLLEKKLVLMKKYITSPWKLKFYIYYHPSMKISELIERVEWCRERECLPYIMRDIECWECENKNFLIDYTAYCNQANIFKKMNFEDFLQIRHRKQERIEESLKIYEIEVKKK